MKPHRQLANELTGIRAKIRELKDREEELRNTLLTGRIASAASMRRWSGARQSG